MDDAPRKSTGIPLNWLVGGGIGVAVLGICALSAAAICCISVFGDRHPAKFVGSWKGRFHLGGGPQDIVYKFKSDGSFVQESFNLDGHKHNQFEGSWGTRGDELMITFASRDRERAAVGWVDKDTFTYRIVDQSNEQQIGLTTTFKRQ